MMEARRNRGWWPASPEAQLQAEREEKLDAAFRIGFPESLPRGEARRLDDAVPLVLHWDSATHSQPHPQGKTLDAKWRGTFFCSPAGLIDKSAGVDTLRALRTRGWGQAFLDTAVQAERQMVKDVLVNLLKDWKEQMMLAVSSNNNDNNTEDAASIFFDDKRTEFLLCLGENWDTQCLTAWLRAKLISQLPDEENTRELVKGVRKVPSLKQLAARLAAPILTRTGQIPCRTHSQGSPDSVVQLQHLPTYYQHVIEGGAACRICGRIDYFQEGCDFLDHNLHASLDIAFTTTHHPQQLPQQHPQQQPPQQQPQTVFVEDGWQFHCMDDGLRLILPLQKILEAIDLNINVIQGGKHIHLDAWDPPPPPPSSFGTRSRGCRHPPSSNRGRNPQERRGGGGGGRDAGRYPPPDKYNSSGGGGGRRGLEKGGRSHGHHSSRREGEGERTREVREEDRPHPHNHKHKRKSEGHSRSRRESGDVSNSGGSGGKKEEGEEIDQFGRIKKRRRMEIKV